MSRLIKVSISIIALILAVVLIFTSVLFFVKRIYRTPYEDVIATEAYQNDIDENLIYAVIKCESNFDETATSKAGAMGLMQLMPTTFEYLQNTLDGQVNYSKEDLLNPIVNIHYGVYYLKTLLDEYNGDERLALCAYNAGTGNVENWLSSDEHSLDGENLDNIPYEETRNYVSHVENTKSMYNRIYK